MDYFLLLGHLLALTVRDQEQHRGLVSTTAVGGVHSKEPLSLELNHVPSLYRAQAGVTQCGELLRIAK